MAATTTATTTTRTFRLCSIAVRPDSPCNSALVRHLSAGAIEDQDRALTAHPRRVDAGIYRYPVTRFKPARDESADLGVRRLPSPGKSEPWDRTRRRVGGIWHRRVSTRRLKLPSGITVNVLDGGSDAPLDERGLRVWHAMLGLTVLLGIVLIAVARLS